MTGHPSPMLVVIVNYRTGKLVIDCLQSLSDEVAAGEDLHVTVVDNASPDGSGEEIARAIVARGWSGWASVRRAPVNGGFAYGNNLALREWLDATAGRPGQLAWLLNPDTVVHPGACVAIRAFFAQHPDAGVIGTAIDDDRGARWPYAFRFPSIWAEIESAIRLGWLSRRLTHRAVLHRMDEQPRRVDWVSGASAIFRREVFDGAGLLDEGYFLYFEETDFFRAVARLGWPCWYVPQARVVHIAGQSTGVTASDAAGRRVPAYWFASRRRYYVKNHGRIFAIVADAIAILGLCQWRLRCAVRGKAHGGAPHFLRDLIRQSALFHRDITANDRLHAAPPGPARVRPA